MLNLFTRLTLIVVLLFSLTVKAAANDSDVVNCNRVWKIAVLGSSTAFGTGATAYDSSWVGKFTAYLKRKNISNDIYNLGIPGFTTYQNLCPTGFVAPGGRPSSNSSYNITAALNLHPDAIIINMPSNDAANNYTVTEQQANFERAVYLADSANTPIWVCTTQPRNNMTAAQVSNLTTMRDWIFTRFGDKAVDFWTTIANGDGSLAPFYDFDYVHVNDEGHNLFYNRIKAETILDSLCIRVTQTLIAKAGNDISVTLPATTASLNGSNSFSSLGGTITSYQWTKISGPINSVIPFPNNALTAVNNLSEGRYSFSLTVTDNFLNVKSDTVDLVVSTRILIDFGPDLTTSPDAAGKYWNTITETRNGIKLTNAVSSGNASTTVGLEVVNRIDGTFNTAGPGTNTGNSLGAINDYPATVTSDFSFAEPSATNGQWKITGLESTKQYTIKFWGTRTVLDDRIIQIKRADQSIWQEYNATNNNNYNTSAIFTFSGKTQMLFDIRVKSGSAFGHICLIDITRTTPALALNIPPTARANDVNVALPGTSAVLDGSTSSDDDGSIASYQWAQTSGPSTVQILSPSASITAVNNLVEGTYTFLLTVTDDSTASASQSVTLTVNSRVLFDIGPDFTGAPDAGGKYWNNVTNGLPGVKTSNAVTTGNSATGINFEIINRIDGTFNPGGPGTNTGNTVGAVGDYPASATTDFAFAHLSTSTGQWKLSGLQSSKQYVVKFWGTRTAADERIIRIKRADETNVQAYNATNNADFNNAAVFTFTGKTDMSFDITVDANSTFGHISLIDIKITNPPSNCTPSLVIVSNQTGAICSGSPVTFTATPTNGGTSPTYQWSRNAVNISGATNATFTTTTLINNDAISCFMTANTVCATGTTATSNTITASVLPIVPAAGNISGPTSICAFVGSPNNAVYSIAALANATTYNWTVPTGAAIVSGQGTTSITVSFNSNFGSVDTLKVAGGICTNSAPSKLVLFKTLPSIPGAITGPVDVCPFIGQPANATYSIAAVANATSYTWTLPTGATIVSGQGTTSVQVSYNNTFVSGSIKVASIANCGSRAPRSLTLSKNVPVAPASIIGPSSACPYLGTNTPVTYSISAVVNATSYSWTLPANITLVSGQGTTSITVTFGATFTSALIKVKSVSNCSVSSDRSLNISTITGSTPGVITGPTDACAFIGTELQATYTVRKVSNALSYIWTLPAGAIISSHPGNAGVNDTIVTILFDNSFVSGTSISVQSAGCVPSSPRSLGVLRSGAPSAPASVIGSTNVCAIVGTATTSAYSIARTINASSYNWVLPAGTSATHPNGFGVNDTTILVTFNTGYGTGTISVTAINGCGSSSARTLSVKALAPTSTPTITGPTDPCIWIGTAGATYKINKIPNAASYTWTVPATGASAVHPNGTGVNDTVIIVTYTSAFVNGNITARADAICGNSSTRTLTLVRKLPSTPGNISTTLLSACPSRQYNYSIATLPANATSVTWTVPSGATIVDGQGTNSITVNYSQAAFQSVISAVGTNNCGNGSTPRTLAINLPACALPRTGNITAKNGNSAIQFNGVLTSGLDLKIFPNPTYNEFKLVASGSDIITPLFLRISDINGRIIEIKTVITTGQTMVFGRNYRKGIYICELIQADKRKIIKLVKL
ncbi:MAG: SGNH/GDSL hydrolase family protein [Ferruginibacter sp.]|nr:SGNH/GDSL hydrolase family protein [Ferruginibacter sp.]